MSVTLRTGQQIFEPGRPYVRCSERDCQYVDVNEAPCPLCVEMFDGELPTQSVREHLDGYGGQAFCFMCLAEKAGTSHELIRRAAWRLKTEVGAMIALRRCAACRERRVTISVPRGAAVGPAASEPRGLLDQGGTMAPGELPTGDVRLARFASTRCAACVALANHLALIEARERIAQLVASSVLVQRPGICEECGRSQDVVSW